MAAASGRRLPEATGFLSRRPVPKPHTQLLGTSHTLSNCFHVGRRLKRKTLPGAVQHVYLGDIHFAARPGARLRPHCAGYFDHVLDFELESLQRF